MCKCLWFIEEEVAVLVAVPSCNSSGPMNFLVAR
jgi:hypothetical protein